MKAIEELTREELEEKYKVLYAKWIGAEKCAGSRLNEIGKLKKQVEALKSKAPRWVMENCYVEIVKPTGE